MKNSMIKEVFLLAWPAICESFFITLAGFVDTLMVSSLGAEAVAAVGLTTQPKFFGLAVFFALNVSISALVARRFGERRRDDANRILPTAILFAVIAACIISLLTCLFAGPIIAFCGSNEDTHGMAVVYYRIIMAGLLLNALTICINSAQRGIGNTRLTMRTNVTANVVNICGNYLLIGGHFGFPALGVTGAAIATVFGTLIGFFMCVASLYKRDNYINIFYILERRIRPVKSAFFDILHIGYAVFLEQLLMRIGFMATAMMAASLGTQVMAAHQVGMNILSMSFSFGDGMQIAAVALIGRSLGEGAGDKAIAYGRTCQRIGLYLSLINAAFFLLFGRLIYQLFFDVPEIVGYGVRIIHVIIFIIMFQISNVIYLGCLRGAGDTAYTAFVSSFSITIVRTVGSYVFGFVLGLGIVGVWLGILSDQISRYILSMIRFRMGKWVRIRI